MQHSLSPATPNLANDLCAATRAHRARHNWSGATVSLGGHAWNLFPEEAAETYIAPSNNDCGVVKSPLILEGLRDLVIDGEGARLLVRGTPGVGSGPTLCTESPMVPIILRNCERVTIRRLSVDWATPATFQGECIAVDSAAGTFDVRLEEGRNSWCWNGQLYLCGEGFNWPIRRLLAVDSTTGAVLPGTGDNLGAGYDLAWRYEMVGERVVRISGTDQARPVVGCTILFWGSHHGSAARRAPAIFIENSSDILLEDVTLHYAWAMGVIAQNSTDLRLRRLVVEPSGSRRYSLAADGAHFVNCRGELLIEHCRFQNQFDDAINSHGLYHRVVRALSPRVLRIRTAHPQHQGVDTYRAGDVIRLCRAPHLVPVVEIPLVACTRVNSEMQDLELGADLPADLAAGDFVENTTAYPEIIVRDCIIRWNRARGALLNGHGPILVERCAFESPGSGIQIESSASWGESGPVGVIRVENNTFTRCGTCHSWGEAVVQAEPVFRKKAPADLPPFHGKLILRGNRFIDCVAPRLLTTSFADVESDVT